MPRFEADQRYFASAWALLMRIYHQMPQGEINGINGIMYVDHSHFPNYSDPMWEPLRLSDGQLLLRRRLLSWDSPRNSLGGGHSRGYSTGAPAGFSWMESVGLAMAGPASVSTSDTVHL